MLFEIETQRQPGSPPYEPERESNHAAARVVEENPEAKIKEFQRLQKPTHVRMWDMSGRSYVVSNESRYSTDSYVESDTEDGDKRGKGKRKGCQDKKAKKKSLLDWGGSGVKSGRASSI